MVGCCRYNLLSYADDIILLAENLSEGVVMLKELKEAISEIGLEIENFVDKEAKTENHVFFMRTFDESYVHDENVI